MFEYLTEPKKTARRKYCKLKLFVWEGFSPDYSDGLAFAIAKNEKEARKLVIKEIGSFPGNTGPSNWGDLTVYPLRKKIAKSVSGGG